jgi:hypothetical protein
MSEGFGDVEMVTGRSGTIDYANSFISSRAV